MRDALAYLVAFATWWLIRWLIARRDEYNFARAYTRHTDGIIVGAEPFTLTGSRPGALLLLHGYNDSPQSLRATAAVLHRHGWTVRVPLLPGHARTLQAFAKSDADAWIAFARAELRTLKQLYSDVAVGGLSLGGAISFMLAADDPDVKAVLTFAPYLHASIPLRLLGVLAPVATLGARYVAGGGTRSVHDPVAADAMIAYRRSTPQLLLHVEHVVDRARAALPRVRQPVLVLQSREDNRIPAESAEEAFGLVGSADKTLQWTEGNGHVITVDYGHDEIAEWAAQWLEHWLA